MSERPGSKSLVVPLFAAVSLLVLVFSGGVFVGWATRVRKLKTPPITADDPDPRKVKRELRACRQELRELLKPPPIAPPPDETDDAGLALVEKGEALRKELEECRVRATIQNAYVCAAIGDHINFYGVLVSVPPCEDAPEVTELLASSVDKCAEFAEVPDHLDEDALTQQERIWVYEAKWERVNTKEGLVRATQRIQRGCRRMWALPPE